MNDATFWETWDRLRQHDWMAVSNGKAYRVMGLSRGAGDLREHVLVTYQCRETGETFVRDLAEWADRMEPAPETPSIWSRQAPTTEALLAAGMRPLQERFYWVRGWDFNRPVLMCVVMGLRRKTADGPFEPELHYHALRQWPGVPGEPMWEHDFLPRLEGEGEAMARRLALGNGWRPLEWGPEVMVPPDDTARTLQ